MEVTNAPQAPAETKWTSKAGRLATEIGLSIGTGIAADRLKKSLAKHGPVPAVLGAVVGAASLKSVAKGSIEVVSNLKNDRTWHENVGDQMLDGLRTGAVDASLGLLSGTISKGVAAKMVHAGIVARSAVTGMVTGTLGGTAHSATDPKTWQEGAGPGAVKVGISAGTGLVVGGALGAVGGFVMKRFYPDYEGGPANRHQVRRLASERGQAGDVPLPEGVEAAVANAEKVSIVRLEGTLDPQKVFKTPEYQDFVSQLKPGDIIMKGRKMGLENWATQSPYTHAMMVTEIANGKVKVVEALEKGVVEGTLDDWVQYTAPDPDRVSGTARGFMTVFRPSKDPQVAAKAVAFAKAQVGQPYNYSLLRGKDPGFSCSQLVYEAYDANPAIPKQLKLLQLDSDKAHMDFVAGVDRKGAVATVLKRGWQQVYDGLPTPQRLAMQAKDYSRVAAGVVKEGARRLADAVSDDGGKVLPADYRYGELKSVTPGDLDLADGRKLHTLVFEAIGRK